MSEQEVAFSSIGASGPGHLSPALVGSRVYGHYRGPLFVRLILKYFLLGHLGCTGSWPSATRIGVGFLSLRLLGVTACRCFRESRMRTRPPVKFFGTREAAGQREPGCGGRASVQPEPLELVKLAPVIAAGLQHRRGGAASSARFGRKCP